MTKEENKGFENETLKKVQKQPTLLRNWQNKPFLPEKIATK